MKKVFTKNLDITPIGNRTVNTLYCLVITQVRINIKLIYISENKEKVTSSLDVNLFSQLPSIILNSFHYSYLEKNNYKTLPY